MPRKPEPPPLSTWDVYKLASKAVWLATVEATDEHDAIERVASERNFPANKLMAAMTLILRKSSAQARIEGRNPAIWPDDDYAIVDDDIPVGRIHGELIDGEPKWRWSRRTVGL
jgi:hypothetical protein